MAVVFQPRPKFWAKKSGRAIFHIIQNAYRRGGQFDRKKDFGPAESNTGCRIYNTEEMNVISSEGKAMGLIHCLRG